MPFQQKWTFREGYGRGGWKATAACFFLFVWQKSLDAVCVASLLCMKNRPCSCVQRRHVIGPFGTLPIDFWPINSLVLFEGHPPPKPSVHQVNNFRVFSVFWKHESAMTFLSGILRWMNEQPEKPWWLHSRGGQTFWLGGRSLTEGLEQQQTEVIKNIYMIVHVENMCFNVHWKLRIVLTNNVFKSPTVFSSMLKWILNTEKMQIIYFMTESLCI